MNSLLEGLLRKKPKTKAEHTPDSTFDTEPVLESNVTHEQITLEHPDFSGRDAIEFLYESQEMKDRAYKTRENFQKADAIIAMTGGFGLGDCIMELRYVLQLAEKTQKKFIVQVHAALMPLLGAHPSKFPNVTFCNKVPFDQVNDQNNFLLGMMPTDKINQRGNWINWQGTGFDEDDLVAMRTPGEEIDQRRNTANLADSSFLLPMFSQTAPNDTYYDIQQKIHKNPKANQYDEIFATLCGILGEPVTVDEIKNSSILPFEPELLENIPQSYDFIIAPDAGERSNGQWSAKSLLPETWGKIFARPELKGKKVGIIKGVAHTKYCQAIIQLAINNGVDCEFLGGDLNQLSQQILSTKTFIGMDSGTTHLAVDVSRFAKQGGREIVVKEIIDEYSDTQVEEYAITDTPVLRFSHKNVTGSSSQLNFDHVTDKETEEIGTYFLSE